MSPYRVARGAVLVLALVVFAALGWRANLLGVRTERPFGSVATAFDHTPAPPGFPWKREGRVVSQFELATIAGSGHCGWESATFIFIGWPPGTVALNASGSRLYIRDPYGVVDGRYQELLERDVKLPSDARPTGHRLGAIELYTSPSDDDRWIYVAGPSSVERWPRSHPMTLCA